MWLNSNTLASLGTHTKSLINKGIYALYTTDSDNFLLKANDHEFYFLDNQGKIISKSEIQPDIKILESAFFENCGINIGVKINAI